MFAVFAGLLQHFERTLLSMNMRTADKRKHKKN
mgnify:FL=1